MRQALRVHVVGALFVSLLLHASSADSPVADAAQRGDLETVRSLLRQGADVNAAQGDGMTALHWAASQGDPALVEVLLYAGATPHVTTRLGSYTPLHLAARNGRVEVFRTLIGGGADPNAVTSTGAAAIHFAAASGRADGVAVLLEHGANVDAREFAAAQTPLMFASASGRLEAMRVLIDAGADVAAVTRVIDYAAQARLDGPERQRRNDLLVAARESRVATQERMAVQTASVADIAAAQLQSRDEEVRDRVASAAPAREEREQRQAALPRATGEPDPDTSGVAHIVEAAQSPPQEQRGGSDRIPGGGETVRSTSGSGEPQPQQRQQQNNDDQPAGYADLVGREGGLSALHLAVRDGHMEAAKMLLAAGADVNDVSDGDGTSPLLIASINGQYDIGMYLLDQGADPNLVSDDGAAPLFATLNNRWAPKAFYPQPTAFKQQRTDYLDFMEALLRAGAEPDTRLENHLWYTSYNFDLLGVKFDGATAFWRAAHALDVAAMKLLVAYGADPNIPTRKGPERFRRSRDGEEADPSGLPPVPIGGPAVWPIHAATGVGYGVARVGNSHRHVHDGWLTAVKYLVEELGVDPTVRDDDGYNAIHHAAARGDNVLIEYLYAHGVDPLQVSRRGQTTVDMANGPQQRVQPFPKTIALLEGYGAKNNHKCQSC